jgi:alpha-beta hydrolase superfamily lysophospholipase
MSASLSLETPTESVGSVTQALYFGAADSELFGWLHRPAVGGATDIGIVLCNPFGYESICSHRSVRAFAEAAAAIGVSALRFDFRGTGDSVDLDPKVDQIDVWCRDVVEAVSELRRQSGVERVYLLGFRLGGLLAALAACNCNDVRGLMAIAPIVSGRRYVREMRTLRMAAMLGSDALRESTRKPENETAAAPAPLEVSGFLLSSATLASLSKVDLSSLEGALPPHVFVIDSETLPVARGWSETLTNAGLDVTYRAMPGIVEMLMTAPQFAVVSKPMIAAMQSWLSSFEPARSNFADELTSRYVAGKTCVPRVTMTVPARYLRESTILTERAVRFGPDAALFGIVTEPPRNERRRRAVILLNPGVDHHIGASRLYVSFARQWGGRGYVVLRMDLAGIGDSATRPGKQDDDVFPGLAVDDIRSAIVYLRENYHVGDISLVGLCSGAYHALRAASDGIQVQRIIMINPQNYFWNEGMSLNDLQLVEVVHNPGVYRKQMLSFAAWKRVIRGQVNLYRIAEVYVQRLYVAIVFGLRNLARRLHLRIPNDLGRELKEIVSSGIAVVFVFARNEPGIDLLKLEAGSVLDQLGSRCRIHILERGDHVFSHHDSRAALEGVLNDELFKKVQ